VAKYFLRIIARDIITKTMEADDDEAALRAAIRLEGKNPDMDLTCGLRRIALRRKSVWYLRPDINPEVVDGTFRHAVDDLFCGGCRTSKGKARKIR
jgi:hypothetical protein